MNLRAPALSLAILLLSACPSRHDAPPPVERKQMDTPPPLPPLPAVTEVPATGVVLRASARDGINHFVPEEATSFDLSLENHTGDLKELSSIDGNKATPLVRAYDAAGARLFEKTPADKSARVVGDRGPTRPAKPRMIHLAPGQMDKTWVNLGKFADPLKRGDYAFEAGHYSLGDGGGPLTSNRVPFRILDARVLGAALGYESSGRTVSVLAWVAEPTESGQKPRLLLRLSAFSGHRNVQQGGTYLGDVTTATRPSVSQVPPDAEVNWLGWVAALTGNSVKLIRHDMTMPTWQSAPIALPAEDLTPIPRFPDRGHAVFLATGKSGGAPVLVGAIAEEGAPPKPAWKVPLLGNPSAAVCAFGAAGAITLLFADDDGQSTKVTKLDIDESGAVIAPEQVVRTTPNRVVALAVDMRTNAPQSFVLLESNRTMFDRLALVRLPLAGQAPPILPLAPLAGWPSITENRVSRALRADAVTVEVGFDGIPRVALVDELGRLHGGKLDGSPLTPLSGDGSRSLFPHVAALIGSVTTSCFTEQGYLFHTGG